MFAGATIEDYSINGGTITLTLTDGDTIAIRHEIKRTDLTSAEFDYIREEREYVSGGISSRAAEAIKNGQAITAAWAEKREAYQPPTPYDEYGETLDTTTETIKLWATFEGNPRPTRPTSNETEYTWRSMPPDFRLTRGEVTVHAASAHNEPDSTRPRALNRRTSHRRRHKVRQRERTPRPTNWPGRSLYARARQNNTTDAQLTPLTRLYTRTHPSLAHCTAR